MQNIEQLYARRNLSVTIFRAALISLVGAGLAASYLLRNNGAVSAVYGGVCLLIVVALTFVAAVVMYVPAQRTLSANGVRGRTIFRHLSPAVGGELRPGDQDILDQLERGLDF